MVLVAKNREVLINIMDILKLFLKERALELNVSKTKVMVFNKKEKERKEVEKKEFRGSKLFFT